MQREKQLFIFLNLKMTKTSDPCSDDWIKPQEHPVLCVPRDDGILLVLGTLQKHKEMSPKEMIGLGVELIERGARRLK